MTKLLNLFIGVPAYGGLVHANQARMWLELGNTIGGSGERFALGGIGYADINGVDRARNFLLALAMQHNADWLLMIDADTWVEPNGDQDAGFQLMRMISDADRLDATIVGAPVVKRALPGDPHELMVYRIDPKIEAPGKLGEASLGTVRGLVPIDALATAVFAVNVRKIGELTFEAPRHLGELGEDLSFCLKVREAGGGVYVDTRVTTGHLGRSPILLSKPLGN